MDTLATKRISIWLLLISWGFSAAMGHPGFALMVTSSINLVILMMLRTVSHFEGEYIARAHQSPGKRIVKELLINCGIGLTLLFLLVMLVRHVPLLWMSTSQ